jgi:ABC-type bacteriocin/lantibiotic exporter with double-glycine peptidase domain
MSIGETIVLGSIAFFASVISDTERVLQSDYISFLNNVFDSQWLSDSSNLIICISIVVVLLVSSKNGFQALVNYWSIRYSSIVEGIFAGKLLSGFVQMPYEWHLSQNSSDLILVTANWRGYIGRSFIYSVLQTIADSLMVTIMLISLFVVQPIISLIVISILGTTSFVLFTTVRRKLDRVALKALDFEQSLNKQATKMIHGFKDVIISGKQEIFNTKYAQTLFQVSKIQGTQRLISSLPTWLLEAMGFFMISFSICYMLIFLDYSVARVSGTITLLAVTAWRVLPAMNRILSQLTSIRNVIPYVEKILNYYELVEENESMNQESWETSTTDIEFKQVIHFQKISFAYKNSQKSALNLISLSIKKGDVIGIIGASGAGKSTFVDIITGLLVPSQGKFLIDNIELKTYSQRMKWMTKLGYVPQTPYIFDGTISENIAFEIEQKNIDTNHVLKCCHMAAMDDFLNELPLGIDSYIGERGVRLSGGQRQRVSIARALYQQPELLIFDEATSALDNTNEKAIQKTIYSLRGKQTMIIVAHRLTTVESCDMIYEFDQGELRRWGRPEEVLELEGQIN